MLILYTKQGCPFCEKVKEAAAELGVEFDERDINEKPEHLDELIAHGGMRQVPFLVDEENNVAMYESDDIITYLTEKYGPSAEGEEEGEDEEAHEDEQENWS